MDTAFISIWAGLLCSAFILAVIMWGSKVENEIDFKWSGFYIICMVWIFLWSVFTNEKPATYIYCSISFLFALLTYRFRYSSLLRGFSALFFIIGIFSFTSGSLNHLSKKVPSYLALKEVKHTGSGATIGNNYHSADIFINDNYTDYLLCKIYREKKSWKIKNLSLKKNILVIKNNNEIFPHRLKLKKGTIWYAGNDLFEVVDNIKIPFGCIIYIKKNNTKIIKTGGIGFPSIYLSESNYRNCKTITADTGIKNPAAVIKYSPKPFKLILSGKEIYLHWTIFEGIALIFSLLFLLLSINLFFFKKKRLAGFFTFILILTLYPLFYFYLNETDTGFYETSPFNPSSRAEYSVISDHNKRPLLDRSIKIKNNDKIIMGYSKYRFVEQKNGFILKNIKKTPVISKIPKNNKFILSSRTITWLNLETIVHPFLKSNIVCSTDDESLYFDIYGNKRVIKNNELLYLNDDEKKVSYGFLFEKTNPKQNSFLLKKNKRFSYLSKSLTLFFIMSAAVSFFTAYSKRLTPQLLFIYFGSVIAVSAGIILLFRLETSSLKLGGAAARQTISAGFGVLLFLIIFIPGLMEKINKYFSRYKSIRKRAENLRFDYFGTFFNANKRFQMPIPLPLLILILSSCVFFLQKAAGGEGGINLVFINLQFVFPVLIILAVFLAFCSADDIVFTDRPEYTRNKGINAFILKYSDIIMCLILFVTAMTALRDFAPLLIFGILSLVVFLIRVRNNTFVNIVFILIFLLWIFSPFFFKLLPDSFFITRFASWLYPFTYTFKSGQFIENLWAVKGSGLFGTGLGNAQTIAFIPEIEDDFILTLIAAETGLAGMLILIGNYILILYPAFSIAKRDKKLGISFKDHNKENILFFRLLNLWLGVMFVIQIIIISAMITGMLPVMGVPLPFIGKGGSSLIFFSFFACSLMAFTYHELES